MTGQSELQIAVQALKAGAIDFIERRGMAAAGHACVKAE